MLDLDYIVSWVEPQRPAKHFTFWAAPATLVFEKAWDITGTLGYELEVAAQLAEQSSKGNGNL